MSLNLYPIHADAAAGDYWRAAKATAEYIRASAVPGEKGVFWQDPEGKTPQLDFYNGSAGIIFFFLQLAQASGDSSYVKDARDGGIIYCMN